MFTIKYTRFVDIDRIVTDFPWDEFESITKEPDYKDNVLNTVEILHIWVIERDKKLLQEIPFMKADLNVIWTDDIGPFRARKVRIFNGAHTMARIFMVRIQLMNEIWIINMVGCVNKTAELLANEAKKRFVSKTDSILSFYHP